jgi:hypothetical protein
MLQQGGFDELIQFWMQAIGTMLRRSLRDPTEPPPEFRSLLQAVFDGRSPIMQESLAALRTELEIESEDYEDLATALGELTGVMSPLQHDEVEHAVLTDVSCHLTHLGDLAVHLSMPDVGYNLYEAAYHCTSITGGPALEIAEKALAYSDSSHVLQRRAAIWRYATERLRASVAEGSNWLEAVDAVELAMNAPVPNQSLQVQLFESLMRAIRAAEGTPIESLITIILIQAPEGIIDPKIRQRAAETLMRPRFGDTRKEAGEAFNFLVNLAAQNMVDDIRLGLQETPDKNPSLTWHNLTLSHRQLAGAVPLGRSLTYDLDRTGQFILKLAHEISHAYCLLGPIGWAHTAMRVAVHYLEGLLLDRGGALSVAPEDFVETPSVLSELPTDPLTPLLADAQLAAALRSSILEGVWAPWLEGVAMFVELLCDPKDHDTEIIAPHEAVRSLIDFRSDPRPGESHEKYTERFGNESAAHFEEFYSAAVRRDSRSSHFGYLNGDDREVYLLGYLLVRSLVARWEETLGRRLNSVEAARLLLDATRNGVFPALPEITTDLDGMEQQCNERCHTWLQGLGSLDRDMLSAFFVPAARGERGGQFLWKDGYPKKTEDVAEAESVIEQQFEALATACCRLVCGGGPDTAKKISADDVAAVIEKHRKPILHLYLLYRQLLAFLPVGKDMARLLFLDEQGRVAICPRTYVGLSAQIGDDLQRYSIHSFVLDGGAAESEGLRVLGTKLLTARVLATRVIDLVGHPASPMQQANFSYVTFSVDKEWTDISLGDIRLEEKPSEEFLALIHQRLYPPLFYADEDRTLASREFLAERLQRFQPKSSTARKAREFSRLDASRRAAYAAAATAFGVPMEELRAAVSETLDDAQANLALANYLHASWCKGEVESTHRALDDPLGRLVLDAKVPSGVKALGGRR